MSAEAETAAPYRVLARKYRPARFEELIGQEAMVRTLSNAIRTGRLAHAFMLTGVRGVGKTTTARIIARALNCVGPDRTSGPTVSPCGQCQHCTGIAEDRHVDVIEMDAASRTSVEDIRELIEGVRYRPVMARYKVYIVDEVHMLSRSAFNALLKTLEEPPAASMFVLVTSRPDVLLPTVLSRCQRLRFGPLSPADVAAVLVRDHGYSQADAHAAAAAADGSIGAALEGASDDYSAAREAASALLQGVAAAGDLRRRLNSARALAATGAARGASEREALGRRLLAVRSLLRDLGILLSRADERGLANADLEPFLSGLLRSFDRDRTLRAFSAVDRALAALDRNASPKIVADWLAFQI
jgi:DNA polymerase-3 subunit gamma/tau